MKSTQFPILLATIALVAGLQLSANGQGTSIRTGASTAATGYLEAKPDAFGAIYNNSGTAGDANGDNFRPAGSSLSQPTFSSGFFVFIGGTQRALLSANTNFQNIYPGGNLTRTIVTPNAASDTNGDGVNDSLTSAFTVTGANTNLGFNLNQRVFGAGVGVSILQQDYVISNVTGASVTLDLVRVLDADLSWNGDFLNDSVGTSMNGAGLGTYVYQNEVGSSTQALTITSPQASVYFGSKNSVDPDGPGGSPAYGFGTDVIHWNAFGIPTGWVNNIANVGYNLNGDSGAVPAGQDSAIGLGFTVTIPADASRTVRFETLYGRTSPVPEPTSLAVGLSALGALACLRRRFA
jgi:hypothetical protein